MMNHPITNTKYSYGMVTKIFHLLMSLSFLLVLILGYLSAYLLNATQKISPLYVHKAIGIFIGILTCFWVLWTVNNRLPTHKGILTGSQKVANKVVKCFLYMGMIMLPLTGILLTIFSGEPTHVFGLFTIQGIFPRFDPGLNIFLLSHAYLSFFLTAVIFLHIASALKHYLVNKDSVMQRMWSWKNKKE